MREFEKHDAEWIRDMLLALHGTWSANTIVKVMQVLDVGMRREDALAAIREWLGYGPGKGRRGAACRNQLPLVPMVVPAMVPEVVPTTAKTAAANGSVTGSAPHTPQVSKQPAVCFRLSRFTRHFVPRFAQSAAFNNAPAREEPAWITTLAEQFRNVAEDELQRLVPGYRLILGRTHALLFAGYCRSESANRKAGAIYAATFARMGLVARFADMTCEEYICRGIKLCEVSEIDRFFNPFDIEAVVEYERETAR